MQQVRQRRDWAEGLLVDGGRVPACGLKFRVLGLRVAVLEFPVEG